MKVEYLFSKNKKIGSRVISWAAKYEKLELDNNPSHAAVLLNENIVIESTFFTGVRIIPYKRWLEINTEVARIPCNNLHRKSMDVFDELTKLWDEKYDWLGILFFAISYIKLILFKEKLPEKNKWQDKNKYFCTELLARLSGCGCSMHSPAKLLSEWKSDGPS